jgi:hypothetical protein
MSTDKSGKWACIGALAGFATGIFGMWLWWYTGVWHALVAEDWKNNGVECFRVYKESKANILDEFSC